MLARGQSVGRYRIEGLLGQGAMGSVYRATDTMLRRTVALKVVGEEASPDPDVRARFFREARAAGAVAHANVVAVYDVGESGELAYLAMELVEGTTLRDRATEVAPFHVRIGWLLGVARGLAAVHARGLVHRDVKPENILIARDGTAKLADFGIVKAHLQDAPPSFRTKTGNLLGTPDYMAPEQWMTASVDARADQYAWGLTAYEVLSAKTLPLGPPRPLREVAPQVPDTVAACVMRAIVREPSERHPSMNDIVALLERFAVPQVSGDAPTQTATSIASTELASAPTVALESSRFEQATPTRSRARESSSGGTARIVPTPKQVDRSSRRGSGSTRRLQSSSHLAPPPPQQGKRIFLLALLGTFALAAAVLAGAALVAFSPFRRDGSTARPQSSTEPRSSPASSLDGSNAPDRAAPQLPAQPSAEQEEPSPATRSPSPGRMLIPVNALPAPNISVLPTTCLSAQDNANYKQHVLDERPAMAGCYKRRFHESSEALEDVALIVEHRTESETFVLGAPKTPFGECLKGIVKRIVVPYPELGCTVIRTKVTVSLPCKCAQPTLGGCALLSCDGK